MGRSTCNQVRGSHSCCCKSIIPCFPTPYPQPLQHTQRVHSSFIQPRGTSRELQSSHTRSHLGRDGEPDIGHHSILDKPSLQPFQSIPSDGESQLLGEAYSPLVLIPGPFWWCKHQRARGVRHKHTTCSQKLKVFQGQNTRTKGHWAFWLFLFIFSLKQGAV